MRSQPFFLSTTSPGLSVPLNRGDSRNPYRLARIHSSGNCEIRYEFISMSDLKTLNPASRRLSRYCSRAAKWIDSLSYSCCINRLFIFCHFKPNEMTHTASAVLNHKLKIGFISICVKLSNCWSMIQSKKEKHYNCMLFHVRLFLPEDS